MIKTIAAEDIGTDEKIRPREFNQSESAGPERPRPADQQVQQGKATEVSPRVAPGRRPLFRT